MTSSKLDLYDLTEKYYLLMEFISKLYEIDMLNTKNSLPLYYLIMESVLNDAQIKIEQPTLVSRWGGNS